MIQRGIFRPLRSVYALCFFKSTTNLGAFVIGLFTSTTIPPAMALVFGVIIVGLMSAIAYTLLKRAWYRYHYAEIHNVSVPVPSKGKDTSTKKSNHNLEDALENSEPEIKISLEEEKSSHNGRVPERLLNNNLSSTQQQSKPFHGGLFSKPKSSVEHKEDKRGVSSDHVISSSFG